MTDTQAIVFLGVVAVIGIVLLGLTSLRSIHKEGGTLSNSKLSHAADLKGTWTFNTTTKTYLVQPHRCHDGKCALRTWHLCVSTNCLKDITLTHAVHTCHDSRCRYNVKHKCHDLDCKERKV